jgi:spore photoproduct lyase
MDCAYCILQSYFHPPILQYFANHDKMMNELDSIFNSKNTYRIGTGEYTDSMIWDYWTNLSKNLVKKFSSQSNAMLELKTKSSNIEKLKGLDHRKKTVVAWSLNTEVIIENEEKDTASLQSRLKAANRCSSWGYPVAFHFDPIIMYDGCEKDYENVVQSIFSYVSSENIIWISLGAFRFMPSLKPIIQKRFPHSKIIYGEFVQGLDNKIRYFKPLRINLYQRIINKIKEISPEVLIYFCMEDDEVWHKALGFTPIERGGLPKMLDKNAIRFCGLDPHH